MGFEGLRNYIMKSKSGILKEINIQREIEEWKSENNTKIRPIVVIDLSEFIHLIAQHDEMAMVLGGRYHLYNKYYRAFFHNLQKCGVRLVFFSAGCKLTDDLMLFIPNRESEYVKYLKILDGIGEGRDPKEVSQHYSPNRQAPSAMEFNLMKICKKYGDLHVNYVRHNQEIAQFMQQHDDEVIAIITNDMEFLVFDGNYQFWSSNDTNMKEMTTICYDRKYLKAKLELSTEEFVLLSALAGSSYLPAHVLKPFYEKIWDQNLDDCRMVQIANYVRKLPKCLWRNYSIETFDLKKVAEDVFGAKYIPFELNAIENGIAQYNLNFKAETIDRRPFVCFCKENNLFIYKLMTDDIYLIKDIMYIDYRNYKSKNYAELVMPLLRKVQGILWNDKRDKRTTRTFCMKYAHDEPYCVKEESILFSEANLPDLFDLIFKNNEKRWDNLRWLCCQWIFDFKSNFMRALRQMPSSEKYTAVLVTIMYLLQQEEITEDEADALLITEYYARSLSPYARVPRTEYPKHPNVQFIRIAHLYTKLYELVCRCLEVSGLFRYTDLVMFDGSYFHSRLDEFNEYPDEKLAYLREVRAYRIYTT